MSTETRIEQPTTQNSHAPAPVRTPVPVPAHPLAEVVAEVREDAAVQPASYLEQTRVPADGE